MNVDTLTSYVSLNQLLLITTIFEPQDARKYLTIINHYFFFFGPHSASRCGCL